jgi:6-methylsalicylic acid synthase
VQDVDEESLRTVMRPKVEGAWVLHELFPPGSIDFLVLFSSCGLLLGLTGQASYASGNAFLDALASHRSAGGHTDTVSFGWTSWRGLGMSTSSAVIDAELANLGTASISATEAFRCWEFADGYERTYFAVLRTVPLEPGMPRLPLLSERSAPDRQDELGATADAEASWSALHPDDLRDYLVGEVCRQVAAELKSAPAELDARRPLAELGLDSVMTVVIRRRLEKLFRLRLPATLLWECPTAAAVAAYLAARLIDDVQGQADAAADHVEVAAT